MTVTAHHVGERIGAEVALAPLPALSKLGGATVQDCRTDTPPSNWPAVQVLALFPPRQPADTLAIERAAARMHARQVLVQRLGATAAASWLQRRREARGAQSVSFSHEVGASLLAWSTSGAVGVDLVDLDGLARASQQELTATASLYLGPDAAAAVAAAPLAPASRLAFALRWCSLEARLKCLGLELDEWQSGLDGELGRIATVRVYVESVYGQVSARWIGCLAWR